MKNISNSFDNQIVDFLLLQCSHDSLAERDKTLVNYRSIYLIFTCCEIMEHVVLLHSVFHHLHKWLWYISQRVSYIVVGEKYCNKRVLSGVWTRTALWPLLCVIKLLITFMWKFIHLFTFCWCLHTSYIELSKHLMIIITCNIMMTYILCS